MKKTILIGITVGIASLAQAVTTPLPVAISGLPASINGPNAYIFQTKVTLDPTLNYIGATINFTGVKFTATGGDDTLNYDLINGTYSAKTITDNSSKNETEDYFQNNAPYNGKVGSTSELVADVLGAKVFTLNQTQTWSSTFSSAALADILTDINTYGYFDLGLDPNCIYNFGSVTISFTTTTKSVRTAPDQAMTAVLLGVSFAGLLVFRRKLCLS
jgi:hypothetical protein